MLVIVACGAVVFSGNGLPGRNIEVAQKEANLQMVGPTWKYTKNDLCVSLYPDTFRYFCSQEREGAPTLILIGNSYANHLYGGLVEDTRFSKQNILSYGSCQPGGYMIDCENQENIIKQNPSIKFAIISSLWPRIDEEGRLIDMITGVELPGGANIAATYVSFLDEKLKFMKSNGVQAVIFAPKPEVMYDIRTCFTRPFGKPANTCKISLSEMRKQQDGIDQVIKEVHRMHPDVPIFQQDPLFCDSNQCNLIKDGMPLLRDFRHYSEYGSRQIIKLFAEWAKTNMPSILN
jgi:hypothetical protein